MSIIPICNYKYIDYEVKRLKKCRNMDIFQECFAENRDLKMENHKKKGFEIWEGICKINIGAYGSVFHRCKPFPWGDTKGG